MKFKPAVSIVAVVALLWAASALACNVPVFRYALERWQNDLYHVVVFHKGDLSAEDKSESMRSATGRRSKGARPTSK